MSQILGVGLGSMCVQILAVRREKSLLAHVAQLVHEFAQ